MTPSKNNKQIKALQLKTILNSVEDEDELRLAVSMATVMEAWRSEGHPSLCIIANGYCKFGVTDREFDSFGYPLVSVDKCVDKILDAVIIDGEGDES